MCVCVCVRRKHILIGAHSTSTLCSCLLSRFSRRRSMGLCVVWSCARYVGARRRHARVSANRPTADAALFSAQGTQQACTKPSIERNVSPMLLFLSIAKKKKSSRLSAGGSPADARGMRSKHSQTPQHRTDPKQVEHIILVNEYSSAFCVSHLTPDAL